MKLIFKVLCAGLLPVTAQAADFPQPSYEKTERRTVVRHHLQQVWPAPIVRISPRAGRPTEITYITAPFRIVEEVAEEQVIRARN